MTDHVAGSGWYSLFHSTIGVAREVPSARASVANATQLAPEMVSICICSRSLAYILTLHRSQTAGLDKSKY